MREIKFRAILNERGMEKSFIEGSLVHITKTYKGEEDERDCNIYQIINEDGAGFFIDNDTIGQYTGLKDKNGKEIYEGDIVKKLIWNELKFEAEGDGQDYSYAKVKYIEELAGFHLVNKDNKILWEVAQDKYNIEVAGNIYENPDLLKGEENG